MDRKKELKMTYKQNNQPTGIYRIMNTMNGKVFIGSSRNIPGKFNSHKFQLKYNVHRNEALQKDWDTFGPAAFSFDIVELLQTSELTTQDLRETLAVLEEKWLDKLRPYDDAGYNKPPKA